MVKAIHVGYFLFKAQKKKINSIRYINKISEASGPLPNTEN